MVMFDLLFFLVFFRFGGIVGFKRFRSILFVRLRKTGFMDWYVISLYKDDWRVSVFLILVELVLIEAVFGEVK